MRDGPDIRIVDITDAGAFERLPPCADPRFDHRSCDYWEDDIRGSKAARPSWWRAPAAPPEKSSRPASPTNPFAPAPSSLDFNPFDPSAVEAEPALLGQGDPFAISDDNPFAPAPRPATHDTGRSGPRKLHLLSRGHALFGSYAKLLVVDGEPAVFTQFGPLSAYPRALRIRELYPKLPSSPLPAVITCVATIAAERGRGLARRLVEVVCEDLAGRGFAAIEAYPDLTLEPDEASAAYPAFWLACGFATAMDDERYPVMRRELD